MAKNHPSGLVVLALSNMGERFGYYTMIAILTLYMQAKFGLDSGATSQIYSIFLALIYLLPVLGGVVADVREVELPLGAGRRTLIAVRKERATPPEYPRRPGLPAKKPLL